ncbi:hypothetical protein NL676_034784 [Syzygium grande]|nr:hypothetical protein NL676_034784 [Syzygium grande]
MTLGHGRASGQADKRGAGRGARLEWRRAAESEEENGGESWRRQEHWALVTAKLRRQGGTRELTRRLDGNWDSSDAAASGSDLWFAEK